MPVYHYTTTVNLPWILRARELRPGICTVGDFPPQDFLWATRSPVNCRTATLLNNLGAYRAGQVHVVRFTLPEADFEPWPCAISGAPGWESRHAEILEESARSLGDDPVLWLTRADALPSDRWLAIDYRTYRCPHWTLISTDLPVAEFGDGSLGVRLKGEVFVSRQFCSITGRVGYRARRIVVGYKPH